jgi:hypothetical protein
VELQHLDLLHTLLRRDDGERALSAVVCAAWALSLRCYTGLNDVCFGFEQVGTSSGGERETPDSGYNNRFALFRLDDGMLLEDLISQGRDNACFDTKSAQLNFNTTVLVRCGALTNGAKQPSHGASVMSEKVRTSCCNMWS